MLNHPSSHEHSTDRPPAGFERLVAELPIPAWIQRALLENGVPDIEAEFALNRSDPVINALCVRGKSARHLLMSGTPALKVSSERFPVVALGDAHSCNPRKIIEDLVAAGVLDASARWHKQFQGMFIQVGDTIDRGPHGREVYELLDVLQQVEPRRVGRLLGNHEVAHLFGYENQIGAPSLPGFRAQLRSDILSGRVVAALVEGDTLYTHAGIDIEFFAEYMTRTPLEIADDLNFRLQRAVIEDSESDPIFDGERGIFWKRDDVGAPLGVAPFRQVVGHTPQIDGIKAAVGARVKYIDAGRVFGEIPGSGFSPHLARETMINSKVTLLDSGPA